MIRHAIRKIILTAYVLIMCEAQTPLRHVSVSNQVKSSRASSEEWRKIIIGLDPGKLRPVVPGSWESYVIDAAKEAASVILQPALDSRPDFYTLTTSEGDILVGRWRNGDSARPERSVWLWDAPSYTAFAMEVDTGLVQVNRLANYVENLFLWDRDPLHLTSVELHSLDLRKMTEVVGAAKHLPTEKGSYWMWFHAAQVEDRGYVVAALSKQMFSYPTAAYVKERFPPLRERLAKTPRQALFDEIGKGYTAGQSILTYPGHRDSIIIAELMSRGPLTDEEVREVVIGSFDNGDYMSAQVLNGRVARFLGEAGQRELLGFYAPALERAFLGTTIHPAAGYVVGRLFGAMLKNNIDFSASALKFLERNQFVQDSLFYLAKSTRDESTLKRIERIAVKPEWETAKESTTNQIRRRLNAVQ